MPRVAGITSGLARAESCRARKPIPIPEQMESSFMSVCSLPSPKMRKAVARHSTMPPVSLNASRINLRKIELETTNIEMELAYNDYILSFAELIAEKEILKTSEATLYDSMKKLHEETKLLQKQCHSLEMRLADIKALSCIHDYQDANLKRMTEISKIQNKYGIKEILSKLNKTLERFNVLCCENIILPSNSNEMEKLTNTLAECLAALQETGDLTNNDLWENGATNYEQFIDMYRQLLEFKKIVEKRMQGIQVEVLKQCSHLLTDVKF